MWLERFSNNAWDRINYSQSVTSISGYGNKQSATGCVVLNLNAGDQIRTRIQVTRTTNLGMTNAEVLSNVSIRLTNGTTITMEEIVGSGSEDPGAFELSYNFPNTGTIYYEQFISPSTGTYTDFRIFLR